MVEALSLGESLGGQCFVAHEGDVIADLALGESNLGAMGVSDLHNSYCLSKPLLAMVVLQVAEQVGIPLATPIVDLLGPSRLVSHSEITILDVLNHRAGLSSPTAAEWRLCPPAMRSELLNGTDAPGEVRYSEIRGWLVLERLVCAWKELDDDDLGEFLTEWFLVPLGLAAGIIVSSEEAGSPSVRRRLRVPIGGFPRRPFPLLSELSQRQIAEIRPAFGALTSARAIGEFYEAVARVLRGEPTMNLPSPETLRSHLGDPELFEFDARLRRPANFSAGFMLDMTQAGFGIRPSPSSFGHTSGMGNGCAFHDPSCDLTISLYLNGMTLEQEVLDRSREHLVRSVYETLGIER